MENEQAAVIGRTLMEARKNAGYSRNALVHTRKLKGKLTGEGLRKIEQGERIPRFENIKLLGDVLGLSDREVKKLQYLALEKNVERVTKRSGNASVTFAIEGKAIKVEALPPKRRTERFVRTVVDDLLKVVEKYGLMEADLEHFRRHARSAILKQLQA